MSTSSTARKGNKVAYAVIGVLVSVCAVGWAIIVGYSEGSPGVTPEVISFQLADRSVRVHYQISKPKGDDVRCALVAYGTDHGELGRAEVTVPRGTGSVERHQELPTSSRATSVTVRDCRTG
ncbi:DUF4307 domain-containing protein [Actinoallomurus purpureus]|uniref:DUF4307 domain-containing protein n=1 Tax=Actinoallomurus purpureus TaxID=478114 RepID=UPI00209301B6|nr:DUF4307 domain-containing protein [Actinoallomurus purpureus]MCO6006689.1 DUF4307 domain-containing protein [Actinoallomurus purpureus]